MRTYLFGVIFVVFMALAMAAMAATAVSGSALSDRLVQHTNQQTAP